MVREPTYSTASVNEAGFLIASGHHLLAITQSSDGRTFLVFPTEAKQAVMAFNAARDKAAAKLGGAR